MARGRRSTRRSQNAVVTPPPPPPPPPQSSRVVAPVVVEEEEDWPVQSILNWRRARTGERLYEVLFKPSSYNINFWENTKKRQADAEGWQYTEQRPRNIRPNSRVTIKWGSMWVPEDELNCDSILQRFLARNPDPIEEEEDDETEEEDDETEEEDDENVNEEDVVASVEAVDEVGVEENGQEVESEDEEGDESESSSSVASARSTSDDDNDDNEGGDRDTETASEGPSPSPSVLSEAAAAVSPILPDVTNSTAPIYSSLNAEPEPKSTVTFEAPSARSTTAPQPEPDSDEDVALVDYDDENIIPKGEEDNKKDEEEKGDDNDDADYFGDEEADLDDEEYEAGSPRAVDVWASKGDDDDSDVILDDEILDDAIVDYAIPTFPPIVAPPSPQSAFARSDSGFGSIQIKNSPVWVGTEDASSIEPQHKPNQYNAIEGGSSFLDTIPHHNTTTTSTPRKASASLTPPFSLSPIKESDDLPTEPTDLSYYSDSSPPNLCIDEKPLDLSPSPPRDTVDLPSPPPPPPLPAVIYLPAPVPNRSPKDEATSELSAHKLEPFSSPEHLVSSTTKPIFDEPFITNKEHYAGPRADYSPVKRIPSLPQPKRKSPPSAREPILPPPKRIALQPEPKSPEPEPILPPPIRLGPEPKSPEPEPIRAPVLRPTVAPPAVAPIKRQLESVDLKLTNHKQQKLPATAVPLPLKPHHPLEHIRDNLLLKKTYVLEQSTDPEKLLPSVCDYAPKHGPIPVTLKRTRTVRDGAANATIEQKAPLELGPSWKRGQNQAKVQVPAHQSSSSSAAPLSMLPQMPSMSPMQNKSREPIRASQPVRHSYQVVGQSVQQSGQSLKVRLQRTGQPIGQSKVHSGQSTRHPSGPERHSSGHVGLSGQPVALSGQPVGLSGPPPRQSSRPIGYTLLQQVQQSGVASSQQSSAQVGQSLPPPASKGRNYRAYPHQPEKSMYDQSELNLRVPKAAKPVSTTSSTSTKQSYTSLKPPPTPFYNPAASLKQQSPVVYSPSNAS